MKWTHSKLKTLVDSARGLNPCPDAKKFIEELDDEFDSDESKKKYGKPKNVIDRFLDYIMQ